MAKQKFLDSNPTNWSLKGGRWNSFSRHRGMFGLWYLVERIGQGRFANEWAIFVFPDSVRVSGYAGSDREVILNPQLESKVLFKASGRGGFDFGKGAGSKGGYREGGSIPFVYDRVEFDGRLLEDGDEFLIQVVGVTPGLDISQQIAEKVRLAEEQKQARLLEVSLESERLRAGLAQARAQAIERYTQLFKDFQFPEGVSYEITENGLRIESLTFTKIEDLKGYFAERQRFKEMNEAEAQARLLEEEKSLARQRALLSLHDRVRETLSSGSNLQETIDFLRSL
jgi:hypothetical protein